MLKSQFLPQVKRTTKRMMIFQQDGAPPHYGIEVRKYLDEIFPGRWLGRCGPMTWAARSPDLSPLDFFAWGYLKNKVYKRRPKKLDDLIQFITEESKTINIEMCDNVIKSFHNRLETCVKLNGSHIE